MFKSDSRAKKVAAAAVALACVFVSPAYAGGVVGKATEITQIANNIELGAILSENVEQLATEIEQLAVQGSQLTTQVNQYTTMIQNLRDLPSQVFNDMLGGMGSDMQNLLKLGRSSWQLYDSANQAMGVLKTAEYTAQAMQISPTDYLNRMLYAAKSRDQYFQSAVKRDTDALKDYQEKIEAWQSASKAASSTSGNLQAQKATALAVNKAGAEITRLNQGIDQMRADMNTVSAAQADSDQRSEAARQQIEKAKLKALEEDAAWRKGSSK